MLGLRTPELLVIIIIALVVFGPSKLPALGAGLGKSIRGFKKAMNGEDEPEAAPPTAPPTAKPETKSGP